MLKKHLQNSHVTLIKMITFYSTRANLVTNITILILDSIKGATLYCAYVKKLTTASFSRISIFYFFVWKSRKSKLAGLQVSFHETIGLRPFSSVRLFACFVRFFFAVLVREVLVVGVCYSLRGSRPYVRHCTIISFEYLKFQCNS